MSIPPLASQGSTNYILTNASKSWYAFRGTVICPSHSWEMLDQVVKYLSRRRFFSESIFDFAVSSAEDSIRNSPSIVIGIGLSD
ncbi:unnamed protein product [Ambrosiozyma monospora]|uniref:Unnamed protein product n=1 Tax=Ambrosiozyma monospora TaxID=43982 RepID=A0ACB5T3U6_AMBMO|nr:unnamed protein product [Ambrosiozyma monospora]